MTFTYRQVGASRSDPMPAGFNHLRYKALIGHGAATMAAATEALLTLDMHRRVGLRPQLAATQAQVGDQIVVQLGPIAAPCQFVWVEVSPQQAGWGYGTLPGHPECGEESFILTRDTEDRVWLQVRSFSRPTVWYTRLTGPLIPVAQQAFARRCGRVLRRLAASRCSQTT